MSVSRPVRGCLVGIGGYGKTWLGAFKELEDEGLARLAAVVVRNPAKYAEKVAELEERGVRCFTDYDTALAERGFDFVGLCTPLQMHRPQVIAALEAGLPVLCEKSAAPTVQDVQAMMDAEQRTGVPLDIAYPRQSSSAVHAVQRALIDGVIGRVEAVVVRGGWLREERYYQRSAWAGRVRVDGLWTLDGPVNNPLAHYLYLGMYFASTEPGRLANPVQVRGELYRARHTIEGEDTACIEAQFDNGVREYYYVTLVTSDPTYRQVRVEVLGEQGRIVFGAGGNESAVRAELTDGSVVPIEHDGRGGSTRGCIENFARYLLGESDHLYCPASDSLRFARVSNGAFDSSGKVHPIAPEYIDCRDEPVDSYKYVKRSEDETTKIYELKGAVDAIKRAGDQRALFSDLDLPWAVKTPALDLAGYEHFPQRYQPVELPWD